MLLPNTVTHSSPMSHNNTRCEQAENGIDCLYFKRKRKAAWNPSANVTALRYILQLLPGDLRLPRSFGGRAVNLPGSARSHKAGHCATSANSGHENMSQPSIWLHSSANSHKSKRKISMFKENQSTHRSSNPTSHPGSHYFHWRVFVVGRCSSCQLNGRYPKAPHVGLEVVASHLREKIKKGHSQGRLAHITTFKVQDTVY